MSDAVHPEQDSAPALEPTIGDQLRLAKFLKGMEEATKDELQEALHLLAHQFFISQPSQIRYLASEAARNLVGS
jgi:hypothetical protein